MRSSTSILSSTPPPSATRQLFEDFREGNAEELARVNALWDRAEEHAIRKGGDFSLAWQQVPGVSEKHLFGFYERHAIRVSFTALRHSKLAGWENCAINI